MAQKHPMETYHGIVRTPADAIKLFEACRLGLLPRVQRRLSEKERQAIRSGSVFVWDEREAGMRRWTDGKSWSASRVSGSFLTYREMEGKRGGGFNTIRRVSGKTPDSTGRISDEEQDDGEPDGYRYKADGLMKQSFSITTSNGQHLHLISYYARPSPGEPELPHPTTDPALRSVIPVKGMYPESSLSDNTPIAAVSRVPMNAQQPHHHAHHAGAVPPPPPAHYAHHLHHPHGQPQPPPLNTGAAHLHQPYPPPPYSHQPPGYSWPPSPNATPPYGHPYSMSSTPSSATPYPPPPSSTRHSPPPHLAHPAPPHSQSPYYHQQHAPAPPLPQPQKNTYTSGPSTPYDQRVSLPPPPAMTNGAARTTPPYSQQPPPPPPPSSSHLSPHGHHLSVGGSPRSLYRPPTLPPVSTAPSMSSSSASGTPVSSSSSASTAISSYATPPGSRNTLPPVSLAISALATTMAAASAPHGSGNAGPPPALTPPRRLSPSPTTSTYAADMASAAVAPPSANKASLSALLHPTPASSEPNSARAGSTNSAGSSPRYIGVPPPALGSPASVNGGGLGSNGNGAAITSGGNGPMPQQYLQLAPSGEDTRALSRLDRKFCI